MHGLGRQQGHGVSPTHWPYDLIERPMRVQLAALVPLLVGPRTLPVVCIAQARCKQQGHRRTADVTLTNQATTAVSSEDMTHQK
jgi:hypothetical protein